MKRAALHTKQKALGFLRCWVGELAASADWARQAVLNKTSKELHLLISADSLTPVDAGVSASLAECLAAPQAPTALTPTIAGSRRVRVRLADGWAFRCHFSLRSAAAPYLDSALLLQWPKVVAYAPGVVDHRPSGDRRA